MCSSLGSSRWLTREELEALLVETVSPNDVRLSCRPPLAGRSSSHVTRLCSSCQYTRFLLLMERLLALPHSSNQDQFVFQFRCQLEAQSKNQMVPPLQQDHRGVAFSTAHGTHARQHWSVA